MSIAGLHRLFLCAVLVTFAMPVQAAEADDDEAIAESANNTVFDPKMAKDWNATIGARSRLTAAKVGSPNSALGFGPYYDIRWKDVAFLSSDRGLGFDVLHVNGLTNASDKLSAGIALNIDSEKSLIRSQAQYRSLDFKGKYSPFLLSFAEYKTGGWRFFAETASFLDHNNGNIFSVGSEYTMNLTNKWSLMLSATMSYGDTAHMRENFGVPDMLALSLGRSAFRLHNGLRDATMTAEAEYQADRHWSYSVMGGYTRLLGEAAESYRVETRSQPFIAASVKYHF